MDTTRIQTHGGMSKHGTSVFLGTSASSCDDARNAHNLKAQGT